MRSTLDPSAAHDYDEPARPAWTFQQRSAATAEKAEDDDLPDDQPVAVGPAASAVTPTLVQLGEAHFWPHARPAGDLSSPGAVKIVTRGDGVWVYDHEGSRYFDTLSGMWLANTGPGRREAADAVHAQICELGYAPDGSVPPATLRLAARVARLAPDPASRVFFTSGGSEAVETAMKMAKKFHRNRGDAGRYKFISRRGSYHGATHGCLSLGGGGGAGGGGAGGGRGRGGGQNTRKARPPGPP